MINLINKTRYHDFRDYYDDLEVYYRKTLEETGREDLYDLSLILVGPRTIRTINRDYRGIDRETDVISFASLDSESFDQEERIELGDIFINRKRVLSQAEEYGHSVKREFLFLYVHGLLHLLGYDHQTKKQEAEMFGLQKKILGDLR
ncbi:MAG: rRNA maturation RNase YbeY [Erysipelotrichaceae bacterium]|nr:rRNA maturation RNase YbeY [Erysipelotrichaceae bacterium]